MCGEGASSKSKNEDVTSFTELIEGELNVLPNPTYDSCSTYTSEELLNTDDSYDFTEIVTPNPITVKVDKNIPPEIADVVKEFHHKNYHLDYHLNAK